MSFLSGNTDAMAKADLKPLGADAYRVSTNEQARPVPYLAGRRRLAVTWITNHFDDRADSVTQTIGKQTSKAGYNYFSSAAGLACSGPVDALFGIYLNGEAVYASSVNITIVAITRSGAVATARTAAAHSLTTGDEVELRGANQAEYNGTVIVTVTNATHFTFAVVGTPVTPATGSITARLILDPVYRDDDNPDYIDILIPDYGTMRLYWGTETQTPDPTLKYNSGTPHPSYRGQCYIVFDQVFLGFNQTNFPNVELVLARWPKPRSAWHSLADIEEDANPVAVICDLLQHPRSSFRVPDSMLDTVTLLATAAKLEAEGLGISPLITRQSDMREVLTRTLEYIDGYFIIDSQGRLGVKLCRVPEGDLTEITDANITALVELNPDDWMIVKTGVNVKFTNREAGHLPDARQWRDAGALRIRGERDEETIDREWITRPTMAANVAKSLGRMRALPKVTGRARLRMSGSLFDDLAPGEMFTFNLSTRTTTNLIFRVEERTLQDSARPEFDITFKLDRSYLYPRAQSLLPTLTGLLAWYKADATGVDDGDAVASWPDVSGNGNHVTASGTPAVQNNSGAFPVVRWNGAKDEYSGPNGGSIRTIVAVFSLGDDSIISGVAGQQNGTPGENFYLMQSADVVAVTVDDPPEIEAVTPFSEGNFFWAIAKCESAQLRIQTATDDETGAEVASPNGNFFLGGTPLGSDSLFNGAIAEVLFYDHVLTPTEQAAVVAYLEAKYSL